MAGSKKSCGVPQNMGGGFNHPPIGAKIRIHGGGQVVGGVGGGPILTWVRGLTSAARKKNKPKKTQQYAKNRVVKGGEIGGGGSRQPTVATQEPNLFW